MEKYLWRNQCSAAPPFPACLLLEKEKREKTFPPKNAGNSEFSLALKKRHSNGLGVFSALQGQKLSEKRLRANTPRIGDQLYFPCACAFAQALSIFYTEVCPMESPTPACRSESGTSTTSAPQSCTGLIVYFALSPPSLTPKS